MTIKILATHSGKVVRKPEDVFESDKVGQQAMQVVQSAFQLRCRVTSV